MIQRRARFAAIPSAVGTLVVHASTSQQKSRAVTSQEDENSCSPKTVESLNKAVEEVNPESETSTSGDGSKNEDSNDSVTTEQAATPYDNSLDKKGTRTPLKAIEKSVAPTPSAPINDSTKAVVPPVRRPKAKVAPLTLPKDKRASEKKAVDDTFPKEKGEPPNEGGLNDDELDFRIEERREEAQQLPRRTTEVQSANIGNAAPFRRNKFRTVPSVFSASISKHQPSQNAVALTLTKEGAPSCEQAAISTHFISDLTETHQTKIKVRSEIGENNLEKGVESLPASIFQRRPKSRILPAGVSFSSLASKSTAKPPISLASTSAGQLHRSPVKLTTQHAVAKTDPLSTTVPSQSLSAVKENQTFPAAVESIGTDQAKGPDSMISNSSYDLYSDPETALEKPEKKQHIFLQLDELKNRRSSITLADLITCTVKDSRKMDPSCKLEAPDLDELMKAQVNDRHKRYIDSNAEDFLSFDAIKKEFVALGKREPNEVKLELAQKDEDESSRHDVETNNNVMHEPLKEEEEPVNVFAPRLKMGQDGKFVLDEESLVIEQTSELKINSGIVTQASSMPIGTYQKALQRFTFRNTKGLTVKWSESEMKRLCMGIQMVGVDFHMLMTLMPDRSHKELRLKFMTLDKVDPAFADKLLGRPLRYDRQLHISRYKAELSQLPMDKYEKRRLKLQFEAKRRNDKELFQDWFLERDFEAEAKEKQELRRLETGKGISNRKRAEKKKRDASSKTMSSTGSEEKVRQDDIDVDAAATVGSKKVKQPSSRKRKKHSEQVEGEGSKKKRRRRTKRASGVAVEEATNDAPPKRRGRPVMAAESSLDQINKSIEAAIMRFQAFNNPPALVQESNSYLSHSEDSNSQASSGNGFNNLSIDIQFPHIVLVGKQSPSSNASTCSTGSSRQLSPTDANSSPGTVNETGPKSKRGKKKSKTKNTGLCSSVHVSVSMDNTASQIISQGTFQSESPPPPPSEPFQGQPTGLTQEKFNDLNRATDSLHANSDELSDEVSMCSEGSDVDVGSRDSKGAFQKQPVPEQEATNSEEKASDAPSTTWRYCDQRASEKHAVQTCSSLETADIVVLPASEQSTSTVCISDLPLDQDLAADPHESEKQPDQDESFVSEDCNTSKVPEALENLIECEMSDSEISRLANDFNTSFSQDECVPERNEKENRDNSNEEMETETEGSALNFSIDRIPSPPPIPENGEVGLIVLPEKLPYAFYFDGTNMIPGLVSESIEQPLPDENEEEERNDGAQTSATMAGAQVASESGKSEIASIAGVNSGSDPEQRHGAQNRGCCPDSPLVSVITVEEEEWGGGETVAAMNSSCCVLNESGVASISTAVLEDLREDNLISEIMHDTEGLDVEAIEETVLSTPSTDNSNNHLHGSSFALGPRRPSKANKEVFLPKIVRRNFSAHQFADVDDGSGDVGNNLTIRH